MIKVLYLIESLGAGGAEAALYSCLRFLDRNRFEGIVCPLYSAKSHWLDSIESLGFKVVTPGLRGRWDWRRGLRELHLMLGGEGIHLIHSQLYAANIYGRFLGRALKLPVVTSIQNTDYEPEVWKDDPGQNWLKLNLFRLLDKNTGKRWCSKWIAVSEFVKKSAMRRLEIPETRIDVIYNSIDFQLFNGCEQERIQAIRRQMGFGDCHQLLLSVARLHPQKGHRHLLSAMPRIIAEHGNVRLLLAGGGEPQYTAELQKYASELGVADNVVFLGIRKDVRELLAACDLFVFPSLYEGLPVALLEALAMECACVASRIRPHEEMIETGISGILLDPTHHGELANAIIGLLSDQNRRLRIGRCGRKSVEDKFDIRKNIRMLEKVYDEVLQE